MAKSTISPGFYEGPSAPVENGWDVFKQLLVLAPLVGIGAYAPLALFDFSHLGDIEGALTKITTMGVGGVVGFITGTQIITSRR
jgi:hypothetical protein